VWSCDVFYLDQPCRSMYGAGRHLKRSFPAQILPSCRSKAFPRNIPCFPPTPGVPRYSVIPHIPFLGRIPNFVGPLFVEGCFPLSRTLRPPYVCPSLFLTGMRHDSAMAYIQVLVSFPAPNPSMSCLSCPCRRLDRIGGFESFSGTRGLPPLSPPEARPLSPHFPCLRPVWFLLDTPVLSWCISSPFRFPCPVPRSSCWNHAFCFLDDSALISAFPQLTRL